jgi:hypothetical protein
MSEFADFERRITAALERIGQGIGALPSGPGDAAAELAELREALQAEKDATSQLAERLRAIKDRETAATTALQAKINELTAQIEAQGLESKRMRKNVGMLRETVRTLRESQSNGVAEPHLLNAAMQAELDALHITRKSELFEIDEIIAGLKPLIEEVQNA